MLYGSDIHIISEFMRIIGYLNLPINGDFIDIYGNHHYKIAGIKYSEYDKA